MVGHDRWYNYHPEVVVDPELGHRLKAQAVDALVW